MTQTFVGQLVVVECAACFMSFGVVPAFSEERQRDHGRFYCPQGHHLSWPDESDLETARRQRDAALKRSTQLSGLLTDEQEQHRRTERRLKATRGVVTRTKRRIAKGLCPRCHQHFPNIERHVAAKHPDYVKGTEHVV
jgi:hypothetical protein